MTDVVITGIGQIPVAEHWELSLRELALMAIEPAMRDSGGLRPDAFFVANMLAPALSQQAHLGALVADFVGLRGIEAVATEAAGASGGAALRLGYLAVASGQADVALVVGIEKSTDKVGAPVEAALSTTLDSDYESVQGLTTAALAALLMSRYLYEFNPPREAFGGFPITAQAAARTGSSSWRRSSSTRRPATTAPVPTPRILDLGSTGGSSTTDHDGNPRSTDGDYDGSAAPDIGAHENRREVTRLRFDSKSDLAWDNSKNSSAVFDLFRDGFASLGSAALGPCLEDSLLLPAASDTVTPGIGDGFLYLVRARATATGSLGYESDGSERQPGTTCP